MGAPPPAATRVRLAVARRRQANPRSSELAGHASITTKQRYADALDEMTPEVSPILRRRFSRDAA